MKMDKYTRNEFNKIARHYSNDPPVLTLRSRIKRLQNLIRLYNHTDGVDDIVFLDTLKAELLKMQDLFDRLRSCTELIKYDFLTIDIGEHECLTKCPYFKDKYLASTKCIKCYYIYDHDDLNKTIHCLYKDQNK